MNYVRSFVNNCAKKERWMANDKWQKANFFLLWQLTMTLNQEFHLHSSIPQIIRPLPLAISHFLGRSASRRAFRYIFARFLFSSSLKKSRCLLSVICCLKMLAKDAAPIPNATCKKKKHSCRDASMQHAIKRIDTSQKTTTHSQFPWDVSMFIYFLQDTLTRLYNIFNLKKGVTLIWVTPQLCILNYALCIKPCASLLF